MTVADSSSVASRPVVTTDEVDVVDTVATRRIKFIGQLYKKNLLKEKIMRSALPLF
jgi:hypothetical protein